MSTRDRKLAELAAISQLYQGINGPQVRQQESQQQNALAILGLLMQQQQHAAQGSREDAQLAEMKRSHEASLAQMAAESTQKHGEVVDTNNSRLSQEVIQHLLPDPAISQDQKMAALAIIDPRFKQMGDAMHASQMQSATAKAAPAFSAIYQAGAKDPKALGQLDSLKAALPTEVYNNQDWGTLNSSLPAAPTAPPVGTGMFANQIPSTLTNQYNALPKAPGPLHWLTNPKPGSAAQPPPNLGPLNWLIDPGTPGYKPPQYDSVGSDLIKKLFGK